MNALKVFKSSAGSGKTFALVSEYLKLVLARPEDYPSILAITFTNKAAEEMKSRIIDSLVDLSAGKETPMHAVLKEALPKTDLKKNAGKALKNILHDYSSFSVSTIDSFFQRILRALARELNLPLRMEVEVEIDNAILDVTDRLLKDVGTDKELTKWLTELSIQKMDDEKGWNLEADIMSVARELFREEHHNTEALSREKIHDAYTRMIVTRRNFQSRMSEFGKRGNDTISKNNLTVSDFAYGASGPANYFSKIINPETSDKYKIEGRTAAAMVSSDKWSVKKSAVREEIIEVAESSLIPLLEEISKYLDSEFRNYSTAAEILKKIYLFGIVNDLQKKFTEYRKENNVILLADTTKLLSDIIGENDTPFLYEKTGNRYRHLLIDEFQDTSLLQWKNLLPLIINALGSGFSTLVVGDVKQSIYRWRGGNMNLLLKDLFTDLSAFQSLIEQNVLNTNYRSKKEIVEFNNRFFIKAPEVVRTNLDTGEFPLLGLAYPEEIRQALKTENEKGGYVEINFLSKDDNEGWKEKSFNKMLADIHAVLELGYSYSDICILVRNNSDGNDIANFLLQNNIEEILSPDSLLIHASPKIGFIINILRFLTDHSNTIARSEIIYYYKRYILLKDKDNWHSVFSDHRNQRAEKNINEKLFNIPEKNLFNEILPRAFTEHIKYLGKLPLYELSEQLVSIFGLNKTPDAYIQRFQDLMLEYSVNSDGGIDSFLKWWETSNNAKNASVTIPEGLDALRIMTIHKSKGLQFPVVLMPVTEWSISPKANSTVWMRTDNTGYSELGNVALSSSSKLLDTYFEPEYREEINQTIIDNLNLMYVAFTRAEEKLMITCLADNDSEMNSVSKLIYRTCSVNESFDGGNKIIIGENSPCIKSNSTGKRLNETVNLDVYHSARWQEKLSLSTHSGDLLTMIENNNITKINYGILVHQVLAGINSPDEIEKVINKIVFDGLIDQEEKLNLVNEIQSVLEVQEIARYFKEGTIILNERDMILPGGEVLRPDRVVIDGNHATVIDFKTGKQEKKHHVQVKTYADVLSKMNYKTVNGVLIYLSERMVVNVDI